MTQNPTADWTLEWVRNWLRARVDDGVQCPACEQHAKVYRRKITSATAQALIAMYRAGDGGTEWVHLPTLLKRSQADEAKARYWGLIEPMPNVERADGSTRTGWWRLTEDGVRFVQGQASIQKFARIYDGNCLNLDGPLVGIRTALGTRFDYDDLMAGI